MDLAARLALASTVLLFASSAWAQEALPETARGPAIDPDEGYLVEEVRDDLYWVSDGSYNMMFLVSDQGVVAVDAPPTLGENLLNAIEEVTDRPVTHVVYSHSHGDHIGAAHLYPDDAEYVAHAETASQLARFGGSQRPEPTTTFEDGHTIELGDQVLELHDLGPNHEPGNIFIYAPRQRTLMLVDVVFPGWVPFKDLALAEDVPGFLTAHEQALSFDFETFVGGHLTRLGDREDVETALAYARDVQSNALAALGAVDFMAVAQEVGFERQWELFDQYLDAVADACEEPTLAEWGDRLGGAEAFSHSHCWTMMESLRIDWNVVGGADVEVD